MQNKVFVCNIYSVSLHHELKIVFYKILKMLKKRLNLRNVVALAICLAVTSTMFSGCKKDNTGGKTDDNEELSQDVLEQVPSEILNKAKELGLEINGGKTPPNIEGMYYATPVILINSTEKGDNIGEQFNDGTFVFSEQNNAELTILSYIEEMGIGSDTGLGSLITGNGNKFSVFVIMRSMYSETVYFFISGKIENAGIRNMQFLLLNEDLQGRLFKDEDGLADRITSTKSSTQKTNGMSTEMTLPSLKSCWTD